MYSVASSLPSKAFSGFTGLGGIAASLYPEKIKDRISQAMSAGQIREIALVLVLFSACYWILLWWLKSGEKDGVKPSLSAQITNGPHSPILSGIIHGDVNFNAPQKESPWDYLTPSAKDSAISQQNIEAARAQTISTSHYKTWDEKPVKRDKTLNDGIFYAASGIWRHSKLKDEPSYFVEMGNLLTAFHQKARDGELSAWGKSVFSDIYEPIDFLKWSEGSVDYLDLLRPGDTKMKRFHTNGTMYADVMISQADFERIWPHA